MYVCMYVCMNERMYECMHAYMYECMYVLLSAAGDDWWNDDNTPKNVSSPQAGEETSLPWWLATDDDLNPFLQPSSFSAASPLGSPSSSSSIGETSISKGPACVDSSSLQSLNSAAKRTSFSKLLRNSLQRSEPSSS